MNDAQTPADKLEVARKRLREHIRQVGQVVHWTRVPSVPTCCMQDGKCGRPIYRIYAIQFDDGSISISSMCIEHCDELDNALEDVT